MNISLPGEEREGPNQGLRITANEQMKMTQMEKVYSSRPDLVKEVLQNEPGRYAFNKPSGTAYFSRVKFFDSKGRKGTYTTTKQDLTAVPSIVIVDLSSLVVKQR